MSVDSENSRLASAARATALAHLRSESRLKFCLLAVLVTLCVIACVVYGLLALVLHIFSRVFSPNM